MAISSGVFKCSEIRAWVEALDSSVGRALSWLTRDPGFEFKRGSSRIQLC